MKRFTPKPLPMDDEEAFTELYERYRVAARGRMLSFTLSKARFRRLTSSPCHYCGVEPSKRVYSDERQAKLATTDNYLYNGIDRMDNDRGYHTDNCVPCCTICNLAKGKRSYKAYLDYLEQLVYHRRQL